MLSTSRFVTSDDEMLRELMIGTSVPRELSECHEDRFRLLCETAFDGVLTVQDGIIRETNQAFARMVGHAGEDLSGQALTRFIAAAARGTQVYDSPCQRKDGSIWKGGSSRSTPARPECWASRRMSCRR